MEVAAGVGPMTQACSEMALKRGVHDLVKTSHLICTTGTNYANLKNVSETRVVRARAGSRLVEISPPLAPLGSWPAFAMRGRHLSPAER